MISAESPNDRQKSSLSSHSTLFEKLYFILLIIVAIVFRLGSMLLITCDQRLTVSLNLFKERDIEIINYKVADGYFPQMLEDFWHSGAYASFFIMLFGGVFIPFVRISALVTLYFCSLDEKHHPLRLRIIHGVDHLGRMIFSDLFIGTYATIFFYINRTTVIEEEGNSGIVAHITMAGTYFYPTYLGVLSNLLGTFLAHHLMYIAETNSFQSVPKLIESGEVKKPMTIFERYPPPASCPLWKRKLSLTVACIVILACFVHLLVFEADLISFKMVGLMGKLTGQEKAFSMLTGIKEYGNSVSPKHDPGIELLALLPFFMIVIVPGFLCLIALALLYIPMPKSIHEFILFQLPFLSSWCGLDIFLIATVSQYYELDLMSKYLFERKKSAFCDALKAHLHEECSGITSEFHVGMITLMILFLATLFLTTRFSKIFIDDRMNFNALQQYFLI